MKMDHPSIHQTEVNRIQEGEEGGWEFWCHSCGYRARYTVDKSGTQRLEIVFLGDPSARHASSQAWEESVQDEGWVDFHGGKPGWNPDTCDEEEWLTPELRAQVEKIVAGFN